MLGLCLCQPSASAARVASNPAPKLAAVDQAFFCCEQLLVFYIFFSSKRIGPSVNGTPETRPSVPARRRAHSVKRVVCFLLFFHQLLKFTSPPRVKNRNPAEIPATPPSVPSRPPTRQQPIIYIFYENTDIPHRENLISISLNYSLGSMNAATLLPIKTILFTTTRYPLCLVSRFLQPPALSPERFAYTSHLFVLFYPRNSFD